MIWGRDNEPDVIPDSLLAFKTWVWWKKRDQGPWLTLWLLRDYKDGFYRFSQHRGKRVRGFSPDFVIGLKDLLKCVERRTFFPACLHSNYINYNGEDNSGGAA